MITETLGEQLSKGVRYVTPVLYAAGDGLMREVYRQMQADFLPGPVLTLHSPAPAVMAGVWSILRETLLAGRVGRASKEAVAATVSKMNECPFCVDAHTSMLHATANADVASAILRGDFAGIRDPHLHSLVQWTLANRTAHTGSVPAPPFSPQDAPEIVGTAIAFQYINRMANVFLGDALLSLPPAFQGLTRRLVGATVGKRLVRPLPPGMSLKFVPQARLPEDFSWAASNSAVADAFAGFAQIVDEAGRTALPEPVRVLVAERVQVWNGEAMGISRRWVEDAVTAVEEGQRAAARLALLTALASYQVDASIIADFQAQCSDDAQLIAATAWASLTAARRTAAWFAASCAVMEGTQ